ncbi:MAG: hypothetical protein GXO65_00820 [Euryarchaeota archaeon]|nr:hypothetical protein [Euryarchaeota archaeon]
MAVSTDKSGITHLITFNEMMEQKRKLEELLGKYGVASPGEIEEKIKKGDVPEHPAYEDYLSALSLEDNISKLKDQIHRMIDRGDITLLILRFLGFARIARDKFSDIVAGMEIFDDRMVLVFSDGSEMTVMYPIETKYSFHWQRKDGIIRIDTAPHHHGVKTFPNHIHYGSEKDVREIP